MQGPPSSSIRRCGRASACPCWRRWRAERRWSPPAWAAFRRWEETRSATWTHTTSTRSVPASRSCSATASAARSWQPPAASARARSAGSERPARRSRCSANDDHAYVRRGEQATQSGLLVEALHAGRGVHERLHEVVPRLPAVAVEHDARGLDALELEVEVVRARGEAALAAEEAERLHREGRAVGGVYVDRRGGEVRCLHHQPATGPENPVQLAQDRHVVEVLEHVLAEHLLEGPALERQRQVRQVVDHVDARERGDVEVHVVRADVRAGAEVQLHPLHGAKHRISGRAAPFADVPTAQSLIRMLGHARRRTFESVGSYRFSRTGAHRIDEKLERYLDRARGWTGVLVEGIPALCRACVRHRPRSRVVNCALVAPQAEGELVTM